MRAAVDAHLVVRIADGQNARGDSRRVLGRDRAGWRTGVHLDLDLERRDGLAWAQSLEIDVLGMPHRNHESSVGRGDA